MIITATVSEQALESNDGWYLTIHLIEGFGHQANVRIYAPRDQVCGLHRGQKITFTPSDITFIATLEDNERNSSVQMRVHTSKVARLDEETYETLRHLTSLPAQPAYRDTGTPL